MPWLTDRRLLTAALVGWWIIALAGLIFGPALGHDEAAFAITARGDAPVGAWLYRSDGTVAIAQVGVWLGGAEWQLRLMSVVLSTGFVLAVYALGRAAYSARTGAWAAVLLTGAHWMTLRNAELLGDLPAAGCLLAGVAVLVSELGRADGPRWRLLVAAPLLAAAFHIRYGSAPVVACALGFALLLWWPAVRARPARIAATLALLGGLLVPHVLHSLAATGKPLGILKIATEMPHRTYVGDGLVTYFTSNPFMFYGVLIAPVMLAGFFGVVRLRHRASWYLGAIALVQMVALGLRSAGQPRYVYLATALLVLIGVETLRRQPRRRPRALLALVTLAWLGNAAAAIPYFRFLDRVRQPVVEAARVMRADAAGQPCVSVAGIAPQLIWYSGCEGLIAALVQEPLPPHHRAYAASFPKWPINLERLLAAQHLRATPMPTRDPHASVWHLEPQ
jgi:4-amino-4-deoxy-L-arabinose transferase-like glycosyltransferase